MELALASTFLPPPEYTRFGRNIPTPFSPRRRVSLVIAAAQKRAKIDGVSDELNSIASQNLDHAPARRRVRSAFANVQQHLDHILFKVLILLPNLCFLFDCLAFFDAFLSFYFCCCDVLSCVFMVCRWLQLGSERRRSVVIFINSTFNSIIYIFVHFILAASISLNSSIYIKGKAEIF